MDTLTYVTPVTCEPLRPLGYPELGRRDGGVNVNTLRNCMDMFYMVKVGEKVGGEVRLWNTGVALPMSNSGRG